MMIKVCYFLPGYFNNIIFDLTNKVINRDNYAYSHYLLKHDADKVGVNVATSDINLIDDCDVVISHDVLEGDVLSSAAKAIKYLILFESEVISPLNWDKSKHDQFDKIFTWHDELVDNIKYFKINFSHKFPKDQIIYNSNHILFSEKKLCALISGNKKVKHQLELYTERVKVIRWFEKNTVNEFDLFGSGWDKYTSSNRYVNYLINRISILSRYFVPKFNSYKGLVDSKLETLKGYKFAICYENAREIPGYITEKIFDCFFAGCVPVYFGAPNITEHIPKNCFIDRRNFSSDTELYFYMKNISIEDYE
ncbi:MAG: glycosyltransferase family 10 domain-containing protein, partial [Shewanella sp.]